MPSRLENYLNKKISFDLLEQIPGYMLFHDLSSQIVLTNSKTAKLINASKVDPVIGNQYCKLSCKAADESHMYVAQDRHVFQSKSNLAFLGFHQYADQSWYLTIGEKNPIFDDDGDLIGLVSTWQDVTDSNLIDVNPFIKNEVKYKGTNLKPFSFRIDQNKFDNKYHLSQKEIEVLFWLLRGKSSKQIGLLLSISYRTVESRIINIKNKMACDKKDEVIEKAIRYGYFNILPSLLYLKK